LNPEGGEKSDGSRCRGASARRHSARVAAASLLLAVLFACVSRFSAGPETGYRRVEPVRGAGGAIGAGVCQDCHGSYAQHLVSSDHHADCESCHGPGQLHVYTAEAADIRFPASADCAACHRAGSNTLVGWTTSKHARSGVLCSDCHDTHNREIRNVRRSTKVQGAMLRHAGGTTRMCSSCHAEVAAQFDLPSHHPIAEGMLECTDCHGPHEGSRAKLGARTQTCAGCHQEVTGPWVYEHAPVTEDCGYCHVPHGASADFLLTMSQPAACISCHTLPVAGAVHEPYALTTRCTDCHGAVHGSFRDPHLRR